MFWDDLADECVNCGTTRLSHRDDGRCPGREGLFESKRKLEEATQIALEAGARWRATPDAERLYVPVPLVIDAEMLEEFRVYQSCMGDARSAEYALGLVLNEYLAMMNALARASNDTQEKAN